MLLSITEYVMKIVFQAFLPSLVLKYGCFSFFFLSLPNGNCSLCIFVTDGHNSLVYKLKTMTVVGLHLNAKIYISQSTLKTVVMNSRSVIDGQLFPSYFQDSRAARVA